MTIAFKARVDDPTVASYRYRVLAPMRALSARGHPVELYQADRFDAYEAIVFSKAYKDQDQQLARRFADAGKRVLLDLCDNHFYNPADLPKYREARADLLAMIDLSDRVICSTETLAALVREEAGLAYTPPVAPDPYEPAPVKLAPPRPLSQPGRLLWFGRHGSPNAEAGMADLLLVRHHLSEAGAKRTFELVVCSDDREKFERLFDGYPVPTRYVAWSPSAFAEELAACDGVVLPLSKNPFVAAKTHNRLTLALSAGAPVVVDRIDSYEEFSRFCYLEDWTRGLEDILLRPDQARARAKGAADYLEFYWSERAVAGRWERALGLPEGFAPSSIPIQGAGLAVPADDAACWLAEEGRNRRPWLLAGSAADPAQVAKAREEGMLVLAIGGAFSRFPCDLAYVWDIETASAEADALERNAAFVLMPRIPHRHGWAAGRSLEAWAGTIPVLARLRARGRLLGFDLWTGVAGGVPGDFEGEEAPLRVLVAAGVRMARHLGVRAGPVTGLEATRTVLQQRTGGVAALRRTSGLSYGPYGYPIPARVFVGSDDEQLMGTRLLDYSIQKYSTMDVVVDVLDFRHIPVPKDPRNRSRTGFSFCRFDIPRLCGFEGRGVYVDADMQVFTDITDLWTLPLEEADILYALSHPSQGRAPQTSVMLLNCAALNWDVNEIVGGLDEGRYGYKDLMQRMCIHPAERVKPLLPDWWNSLERYEPGRTSLIHYTDMPTQPWVSHANKNGALWYRAFAEALNEGFISEAEVAEAIAMGHISPRLPEWIGRETDQVDEAAAAVWVAPYHRFTRANTELEGSVALTSDGRLVGWAFRPNAPDEPVKLAVCDGESVLLEFTADKYREILERHGKGSGCHAFDVEVSHEIWRSNVQTVRVRAEVPSAELAGSPLELIR